MANDTAERRAFVLSPEPTALADAPIYRDFQTHTDRLRALAGALVCSPGFREMKEAALVLRAAEPARLALLGRFTAADILRIENLAGIVAGGLRRLRYVSYAEAERAADTLATRLVDRLGADTLDRCRFVAIPRGGLLVLGMLSYVLDLRPDQLHAGDSGIGASPGDGSAAAPVIVVDDCALSGLRFAEMLESLEAPSVVFAHLYSHPRLREELERRESRLMACVAAADLTDLGDELLGEERESWEARWNERSDGKPYWIGLPEHVCFPWNEPDTTIWNAATEAEEAPWRIVPPEHCVKNRMVGAQGPRFQEQAISDGAIRPAEDVVYATLGDEVLAANVETGQVHAFPGTAGDIWMDLVETGSPERVVERLIEKYEVEPEALRGDVEAVLSSATELGLLRRTDDPRDVG